MQYNSVLRTTGGISQKKTQSQAKEYNDDAHSVNKKWGIDVILGPGFKKNF